MNVSLEEDVTTSVPTPQDLISALVNLDTNWTRIGIPVRVIYCTFDIICILCNTVYIYIYIYISYYDLLCSSG